MRAFCLHTDVRPESESIFYNLKESDPKCINGEFKCVIKDGIADSGRCMWRMQSYQFDENMENNLEFQRDTLSI